MQRAGLLTPRSSAGISPHREILSGAYVLEKKHPPLIYVLEKKNNPSHVFAAKL
jgi:hypothetical protein